MTGVIPWEQPLPEEHSKKDGCAGYSTFDGESTEYDCDYEFAGGINCEDCIFGPCEGTQDPRVDPSIEEDEEEVKAE